MTKLEEYIRDPKLFTLHWRIISYLSSIAKNEITEEQAQILHFLKRNPINVFPYNFIKKYKAKDLEIKKDKSNNLFYTLLQGKRLYFKRNWKEKHIKRSYPVLQIEQDEDSPHRYLTEEFNVKKGDLVLDIGAAEGNFSLSVVEEAEKLFLFESDSQWIEALEATFSPWKSKIEIINKFVSNVDDEKQFSLNTFFKNNKKIDFIKMDVEGAELDVLKGSIDVLRETNSLKLAVCTYHRQNDASDIKDFLEKENFKTEFSKGYMIFYYDRLKTPYLRKAVLRAKKDRMK